MYYRHLLSDLKNNRPVYGLQPPPLNGEHKIPRTIEAMAAGYITEIRTVQPRGPYLLAGHSFGGKVCFEIAQQLVRAGERVSFLGLIDTQLRVESNDSWQTKSAPTRRIQDLIGKLRWVRHIVLKRWYSLRLELGYSIPHADRPYHYDWLCVRASRFYLPKPYAGHITMFSSAGNSERQKVNWGPLARSGLTIFELPATHDDIVLPPCSRPLAQHFDNCLDRAGVE
jgi:acetoacetyl-CoA synthetase